jgi:hypothetical protein
MSTSRSSGASVHPTRQQLDELDALLERMLALPVSKGAEENKETRRQGDKETRKEGPSVSLSPCLPVSLSSIEAVAPAREGRPVETAVAGLGPRIIPGPPEEVEPDEMAPLAVQPPHRLRERHNGSSAPPALTEEASSEEAGPEATGDWIPMRSSWKPSAQTWPPLAETWQQAQQTPDTVRIRHDERAAPLGEETPVEDAEPFRMPNAESGPREEETPSAFGPQEPREHVDNPVERGPWSRDREPSPEPTDPVSPETRLRYVHRDPEPSLPQDNEPPLPAVLVPVAWFNQGFDAVLSLAGPLGRGMCSRIGRNILGALGILCLLGAFGLVVAHWLGWTW